MNTGSKAYPVKTFSMTNARLTPWPCRMGPASVVSQSWRYRTVISSEARNLIVQMTYKISPFGRDDNLSMGHYTRWCGWAMLMISRLIYATRSMATGSFAQDGPR